MARETACETARDGGSSALRRIRWIRSILISAPIILLATAVFGTLAVAAPSSPGGRRMRTACQRTWAKVVLAASFVRLSVTGLENLRAGEPYLFCVNHLSYLDPPVLLAALPMNVRFVAKQSLFSIPFLGWAMRREGDLPIDRDRPRAAAQTIAESAERLRNGTSLVVFPEGGRSFDGELHPFHSGALRLAIRAQAPVVPVAISGSYAALRPGTVYLPGRSVRVLIGAPVATAGSSQRDNRRLTKEVERVITGMLRALASGHLDRQR